MTVMIMIRGRGPECRAANRYRWHPFLLSSTTQTVLVAPACDTICCIFFPTIVSRLSYIQFLLFCARWAVCTNDELVQSEQYRNRRSSECVSWCSSSPSELFDSGLLHFLRVSVACQSDRSSLTWNAWAQRAHCSHDFPIFSIFQIAPQSCRKKVT